MRRQQLDPMAMISAFSIITCRVLALDVMLDCAAPAGDRLPARKAADFGGRTLAEVRRKIQIQTRSGIFRFVSSKRVNLVGSRARATCYD